MCVCVSVSVCFCWHFNIFFLVCKQASKLSVLVVFLHAYFKHINICMHENPSFLKKIMWIYVYVWVRVCVCVFVCLLPSAFASSFFFLICLVCLLRCVVLCCVLVVCWGSYVFYPVNLVSALLLYTCRIMARMQTYLGDSKPNCLQLEFVFSSFFISFFCFSLFLLHLCVCVSVWVCV